MSFLFHSISRNSVCVRTYAFIIYLTWTQGSILNKCCNRTYEKKIKTMRGLDLLGSSHPFNYGFLKVKFWWLSLFIRVFWSLNQTKFLSINVFRFSKLYSSPISSTTLESLHSNFQRSSHPSICKKIIKHPPKNGPFMEQY
jgi:hypothetical protein